MRKLSDVLSSLKNNYPDDLLVNEIAMMEIVEEGIKPKPSLVSKLNAYNPYNDKTLMFMADHPEVNSHVEYETGIIE